jgi:hypothetical protein
MLGLPVTIRLYVVFVLHGLCMYVSVLLACIYRFVLYNNQYDSIYNFIFNMVSKHILRITVLKSFFFFFFVSSGILSDNFPVPLVLESDHQCCPENQTQPFPAINETTFVTNFSNKLGCLGKAKFRTSQGPSNCPKAFSLQWAFEAAHDPTIKPDQRHGLY